MDPTETMDIIEQTAWLFSPQLALLLASGVLLGLDALRPRRSLRRWAPAVALLGLAAALVATAALWAGEPSGFSWFATDAFGLAIDGIVLVSTGLVILIASVIIQTRPNPHHGGFYALLLLSAMAASLAGTASDLVVIVLALELFSATSYFVIGYLRGTPRSGEAAIKFFGYAAATSAVMVYGLSWLYGVTGTTQLAGIAAGLEAVGEAARPTLILPMILITAGLAAKMAAVPFHQWLPDVYEGTSSPITAYVASGPAIAGFAVMGRLFLTGIPASAGPIAIDWRTLLMALAALSMLAGGLVALWQRDARRLLAYVAIGQTGCLLIGLVTASPQGVTALLLGLAAYVLGLLGAVAALVALSHRTRSYAIKSYAGMHQQAPEVTWPLFLCLLSLTGIPPTAGFISRLALFSAAIESGLLWLAVVGVVSSVVSAASVWKLIRILFIIPTRPDERLKVAPALAVALGIASLGVIAVTVFASPLSALAQTAAQTLFP